MGKDMQMEIRVRSQALFNRAALEAAVDQAATVIYRDHPTGGPSVAGNLSQGEIGVLVSVDEERPLEWAAALSPLLQSVLEAVPSPIIDLHIAPVHEATAAA